SSLPGRAHRFAGASRPKSLRALWKPDEGLTAPPRTRGQGFRALDHDRWSGTGFGQGETSALPLDPHRSGFSHPERRRAFRRSTASRERPCTRNWKKEMARSGSENRRRQIPLKARFTEAEAALIQEQADRAGVSVA